jgi:hypothetical protein
MVLDTDIVATLSPEYQLLKRGRLVGQLAYMQLTRRATENPLLSEMTFLKHLLQVRRPHLLSHPYQELQ